MSGISCSGQTNKSICCCDIHCACRDRSQPIEHFWCVPIDISQRTRCKIRAIRFDELKTSNVIIFFNDRFGCIDLCLGKHKFCAECCADRTSGQICSQRSQNPSAMSMLIGVIASFDTSIPIVGHEVPFSNDIERMFDGMKRFMHAVETRIKNADDHSFAVKSAHVHRRDVYLEKLSGGRSIIKRGNTSVGFDGTFAIKVYGV